MGPQHFWGAAAPPQQELPAPRRTRNAASPYFSCTTSLSSIVVRSSLAQAHNGLWFYRFVARAAFRIQEAKKLLQYVCVSRVPEIRTLSTKLHQPFVLEFFEMMR